MCGCVNIMETWGVEREREGERERESMCVCVWLCERLGDSVRRE